MANVCSLYKSGGGRSFSNEGDNFLGLSFTFCRLAGSRAERQCRDQSWAGFCGHRTGAALWKGTGPIPLHGDGVVLCWKQKCCDKERILFKKFCVNLFWLAELGEGGRGLCICGNTSAVFLKCRITAYVLSVVWLKFFHEASIDWTFTVPMGDCSMV